MTAERAMVGHSILGVGDEKSFISIVFESQQGKMDHCK
jgi:hypothetical protein